MDDLAANLGHTSAKKRNRRLGIPLSILLLGLVACGAPPPTDRDENPDPTGRVTITSPAQGSRVSGAVYFAAQVTNAADIATLELRVGGEIVRHEFPGETPLRVFLIPRDHPEGQLQLSASVGSGGSRTTASITVNVVHEPPATASVGGGGAIVGAREVSGAISTVSIPAATANGASVSFETLTQAEVLAATGVDYDALGVTFLGAQEIRSTIPTGDGVAMTSGGFGPMVQSGQIVVSYRIMPDAGRGVGELMVINGAAVAPNGDIVSNRPVVPNVAGASSDSLLGAFSTGSLFQSGSTLPAGPPGTSLVFGVNGLNIYAVHGYNLRFKRGGQTVTVPAIVGLNGDGRQYLIGYVPQLPTGTATVEIVTVAGERIIGSYQMNVTAAPSVADPKALVDAAQAQLLDLIADAQGDLADEGIVLNFGPLTAAVQEARSYWASRPANDPELVALARMLAGGGITQSSLVNTSGSLRPAQTSALCALNARKYAFDRDLAARAFKGDRFETGLRALQGNLSLGFLDRFADRLEGSEYDCDPYEEILCEEYGIGEGCGDTQLPPPPDPDSPNDPLPRPPGPDGSNGPSNWITGMGSISPPGGPLGGSSGPGSGGSGLRSWSGEVTPQQVLEWPLERGRYVVRVMVGANAWPFATEIGPDGYFFLPSIPASVPSQLVVADMHTFQECTLPVTGRSMSSASAIYVDLATCLEGEPIDPDEYTIHWVGTQSPSNWTTPSNWNPPRVPNETDDVLIPLSTNSVTMPAGPVAVRSIRNQGTLRMSGSGTQLTAAEDINLNWLYMGGAGSTLSAGGDVTYRGLHLATPYTLPSDITSLENLRLDPFGHLYVNHELQITGDLLMGYGGTLRGSGRTILMPGATGGTSGAPGFYSGGGLNDSHTLEIRSTFESLTEGVTFSVVGTSSLHVAPQGVFRIAVPVYAGVDGASPNGIYNEGLILIDTPRVNLSGCFHNHGTIRILAGQRLESPASNCGGDHNYGTIEGAGTFDWTNLEGVVRARELEFGRGRFRLSQNIQVARLFLHLPPTASNTVVTSNGTITVSELMSMGYATLGGTGTTIVSAGASLEWLVLDNTPNRTITGGHTLITHGNTTWGPMPGTQVTIAAGSELRNHGTFTVQNDRPMAGGGTFRNFGVLTKTTAGVSTWAVCYDEEPSGSYVSNPGTISFTGVCP
ncbi:MAG: hypothetical protein KF813_06625 [Trueperaceae bacterium]|nr:hypothetical protein [Trueperaceae bacterium]